MEIYRLFAAIRPPENIVENLTRLQKGIPGARWSDAEKLHVTLGFFGDVDGEQAEALDERLAEIHQSPFEIVLSGVGHYGRTEPHAIWAGVDDSPALTSLHKKVRRAAHAAGVEMEKRDYRPHVTLAYFRGHPDITAIAKWEQALFDYESGPFLADEFFLYSSTRRKAGANIYKIEASYPLLG